MKYVIIIFSIFFFVQCNHSKKDSERDSLKESIAENDALTIIASNNLTKDDTIRVTQFIDSLFYIPLEKTEKCVIRDIQKVLMTSTYIFILDNLNDLYMFRRDGSFLRKIVGECWGFDVLEQEKRIYCAHNKGNNKYIAVYDFDGKTVHKKINLSNDVYGIGNFIAAIDTGKIAVALWNTGKEDNRLEIIGMDGRMIKTFPNHEKFTSANLPQTNASRFHRMLFRRHGEVRFHPYYSDTLFAISAETNSLSPVCVEQKITKVPLAHRLEYTGNLNEFINYCRENDTHATRFFESDRYFFIIYNLGYIHRTLACYLLYDKQTGELYNYKQQLNFDTKRLHFGIFNDYDGGLPFEPNFDSGEYLIQAHKASQFVHFYTKGREMKDCDNQTEICEVKHYEVKSNVWSNKERKPALENTIKKIRENDNPILVVAKLKKTDDY